LHHYSGPEDFMPALTAGQLTFDVVLASPPLLGNLQAAEQIAPLADFFPPSFIDAFAAVALEGATQAGHIWGLPDTAGFHLMLFYNKELVEALTPFGGWLTDETGRPTLQTPAMEAALALYSGWQTRPPAIAPTQTYDEMRTGFLNGNIAMIIDGDWAIRELDRVDKINWGVAPLPTVSEAEETQPAPLVLGRYWAISPAAAAGDRSLASTALLEFMTRPERQLAWTRQFGLLPTHRAALADPFIVNDPILRASATQMQAGRAVPLGTPINLLLDAMREPLQGFLDGSLTPQETTEMMQTNVER
jgi:ABC-type glycerol-3-phosphate transport system substrate-binding protein